MAACAASTPLTPASALAHARARIAAFDWIGANDEHLVDSKGRLVILRGFVTTPHGRGVRYDYTIDDYRRMRALGANYQCIRLTMGALGAWVGRQPDPGYMAQIDSMVALAKQVGMYSSFKLTTYDLPDFEETGWSALWENNRGEQEAIINGWKAVWERYKDEPAVVGYDLLNEPHAGTLPLSDEELATQFLIPFYQNMIDAMQKIDGRHLAFFQPIAPPSRTHSLSFEGARIHRARVFPNGFTINHSAGITLAFDAAQPSGLRVVGNAGHIDANAFSWNESSQTLTVQEWLTGVSVTLEIR